jgi:serine phosphatase RsbU (regulator of sigma subunit)
MYFGNANGVLEYDGANWRMIPVSNNSLVRSIAIDSSGIVYVGAVGEFGYLSPNEKGFMAYHSLVDKLPKEEQDFADVWKTYATPDGVYFQTFTKLIRIKHNTVKIWKPENSFHFSFFVRNKFYINERGAGLKELTNDRLNLVKGGAEFSGSRIYSMLPYPGENILVATREKGLYLLRTKADIADSAFTYINSNSNGHLINDQVYGGVSLKNGNFAFATLLNGILITDLRGNVVQILNKKNGLQDDIVKYVALDNQNDLWAALGKGISHIEISSPLTSINDARGLNGFIEDIIKFRGKLYVATSLGVFTSAGDHFVQVENIKAQTWSLKKFITKKDTMLLASSEAGIFEIKNTTGSLVYEGFGFVLHQWKKHPERLFIGMGDGFSSIRYENKSWVEEDYLKGIDVKVQSIAEDAKGDLWLGTPVNGLIKLNFDSGKLTRDSLITSWNSVYTVSSYDTLSGIPDITNIIPYNFKGNFIFATNVGLYEYNEKTSKFFRSPILKQEIKDAQVYRFAPQNNTSFWMFTVKPNKVKETGIAFLQTNGSYNWYTQPFLKISDWEIHAIYPDDNGITWLGAPDGLLRYDAHVKKDFHVPFYVHIRQVQVGKDSLLFGGNLYRKTTGLNMPIVSQEDFLKPTIDYGNNSLTFYYSATNYSDNKNNTFSFFLEGHENDWSAWSKKTGKEYTDLKEGEYVFHVKAKSIYGNESTEATYAFTILPPWYRTIWAYIAYVIAFIGFVYLIIRISVRRLVKAKNQLEKIVKERTAEVVEQKQLIEEKHKEITDSINYAERIQRSFLATKELLNENLKDHFVFFQPKDVVSGDFYWATKLVTPGGAGNFVLVTADSTGHGVPGSIMSILNISSLESTVKEGITEPAEILNHTRAKIIERLKKDGSPEGGKDGMDASLIAFDFKNNRLSYAAANNPVWIVREGRMMEYAPDKMPVGKHDKDTIPFTQHTIELQKGDVVYALTDGFPDQFGGPKGKKFMYKNLKELLVSIALKPMEEQNETLKAAFNTWKGSLEQVDDVCLIGVRIL